MNLNLNNFKKIEETDKHVTIEHPSGNKIKIAHEGISDALRKQLEELPTSLAKGGKVHSKWAQKNDPNYKKKIYKEIPGHGVGPEASGLSQVSKSSQPSKDPSYNEPPDMGAALPKLTPTPASQWAVTEPKGKPMYPPCINPSCKSYGHSHPNCRCYGGNEYASERFAEGGAVEKENFCDANRTHFKGCEYFKDGGEAGDKISEGEKLDLAKQEVASENPAPFEPNPQINIPETAPADTGPAPVETPTPQAEPPPQNPVSTPGPDYNDAGENISDPVTQVQNAKQAHLQDLLDQSGTFNNELNQGQITPEHYFHLFERKDADGNPTTLGKIGTAFGLMMGGIGSGLTHQPNAALTVMQNEIDNDLKAQEQSSQNKQNFLRINQQGFLNRAQEAQMSQETKSKAYALTRMQMNNAALHKQVQDASKFPPGSPQRKQADAVLAMLNQGVQNENFNIADRAATAAALGNYLNPQGGNQNTLIMKSGLLGPEAKEVGADIESKTIPGIGQGTLPVPQHVRDQVQAMKTLSDKASDLMQYSGKNFATLSPAKRAIAQQKASEMVNFYNNSIQGGVLTQGRLGWLDDQIKKNPTGIITQLMGNQQRLNEIKQSNDHRMNLMLQQYGVPSNKEQESSEQTGTMKSQTGRHMYQKDGKWYYK